MSGAVLVCVFAGVYAFDAVFAGGKHRVGNFFDGVFVKPAFLRFGLRGKLVALGLIHGFLYNVRDFRAVFVQQLLIAGFDCVLADAVDGRIRKINIDCGGLKALYTAVVASAGKNYAFEKACFVGVGSRFDKSVRYTQRLIVVYTVIRLYRGQHKRFAGSFAAAFRRLESTHGFRAFNVKFLAVFAVIAPIAFVQQPVGKLDRIKLLSAVFGVGFGFKCVVIASAQGLFAH